MDRLDIDAELQSLLAEVRGTDPEDFRRLRAIRDRADLTPADRACVEVAEAILHHVAGRYEPAFALMAGAVHTCEETERWYWAARGWSTAGLMLSAAGLVEDGLQAMDHAENLARRSPGAAALVLRARATLLRRIGRLDEAARLCDDILADDTRPGADPQRIRDVLNAASTWQQAGRADDARRALDGLSADLAGSPLEYQRWHQILMGWVLMRQGCPASGWATLSGLVIEDLPFEMASSAVRCLLHTAAALPDDAERDAWLEQVANRLLERPEVAITPDQRQWLHEALAALAARRGDAVHEARQRSLAADADRLRRDQEVSRRRGRQALDLTRAHQVVQLAESRRQIADLEAERAALLRQLGDQQRQLSTLRHDLANELTFVAASLPPEDLDAWCESDAAQLRLAFERLSELMLSGLDELRGQATPLGAVDLADVARRIALEVAPAAARRGLQLEVHAPTPVLSRADRPSVTRIIGNLISNELRYAVPGPVAVAADVHGGVARLRVTDRGPGLPSDLVVGAYRSRVQGTRGSGLGLYAVRSLAEALGGLFTAERHGPGTAFTVTLPLAELDTRSGPG